MLNGERVVVVGDVMLDHYFHGEVTRISPEAPVPVFNEIEQSHLPGGAANLADALASLGIEVSLFSWWGDDPEGEILESLFREKRIQFRRLGRSSKTSTKRRFSVRGHALLRSDVGGEIEPLPVGVGSGMDWKSSLETAELLIISDYGKHVLPIIPEIMLAAKDAGLRVLVDPKGSNLNVYGGAYLLKPNLQEFRALFSDCADDDSQVLASLKSAGIGHMLVTMGGSGMKLFGADRGEVSFLESNARREIFDVTGAGDLVLAGVASSLLTGHSLSDAIRHSSSLAEESVLHYGSGLSSEAAVKYFCARDGALVEPNDAARLCTLLRREGKKIVFTNGCFDVLHVGHLSLLREAAEKGDFLIVGLNSDNSVRGLKGRGRPVNPAVERASILGALEVVDCVVGFDDKSPAGLIEILRPDFLIKGGDYRTEDVVGRELVERYGGSVHIATFIENHSSSNQIRSMRGRGNG